MRNSGQFFTAEIDADGKRVNRTYFPKNWTHDEIQETLEEVWKTKELIGYCGGYIIFQGVLQGHINIRFIVNNATGEIVYNYPMFDIALSDNIVVDNNQDEHSFFGRLKQKVSELFAPKEEAVELTDEMHENLKNQLMMNFRRIVLRNEMDRSIELRFIHSHEGQEIVDMHYMGPKDSGQIPYFIAGTLCVIHEDNSALVDISDVKKEYIFTVHSDGSITQLSQKMRELN